MPEIERFLYFIVNLKINETCESVVFIGIYVYFHVQFLKTAKNNPPLSSPSLIHKGGGYRGRVSLSVFAVKNLNQRKNFNRR